jgi:hypothetical protein
MRVLKEEELINLYSPAPAAHLLSKPNCTLDLNGTTEADARDKLNGLMAELAKKGITEAYTNITDRDMEVITLSNANTITLRWSKDIR